MRSVLQKINNDKSVYEIQLINLHLKMEGDKRFYQLKYSDDFPSIVQLQKSIGPEQALISFYNTPGKMEVFALTNSSFNLVELIAEKLFAKIFIHGSKSFNLLKGEDM